jgi:hypothetical protein
MRLVVRLIGLVQLAEMLRQIQEMAVVVLELLMPEVTDGTVVLAW